LYLPLLNVSPKLGEMGLANANMRDGIDVMRKGSPHVRKTPSELVRSTLADPQCLNIGGDGALRLHELPTPRQAPVIREALGIRKRQEISTSTRERLMAFAFDAQHARRGDLGLRDWRRPPSGYLSRCENGRPFLA